MLMIDSGTCSKARRVRRVPHTPLNIEYPYIVRNTVPARETRHLTVRRAGLTVYGEYYLRNI